MLAPMLVLLHVAPFPNSSRAMDYPLLCPALLPCVTTQKLLLAEFISSLTHRHSTQLLCNVS